MRRLAHLALPCLLLACAATRPAAALPEHEVLAAEAAWYTALAAKDAAALEGVLAAEFVLNGSSPGLETRAQYLQTARMSERTLQPIVLENRQARVYGNTAVTTGLGRLQGEYKGRPIALAFQFTSVFVHRDGRWQAVNSHVSILPQ
jgi:ketosteroid isomerase-like protein